MRIGMLYFAALRERAGTPRDELEVAAGARIEDALAAVLALRPALAPLGRGVRVARNLEFAQVTDLLCDGDELALLPPVSGG